NESFFATPPEGMSPRMEMYRWTEPSPPSGLATRDSGLDLGLVAHEYGHGVSNRLTGLGTNANALNALQSAGMGEGWSDFFSLIFTQRATDQRNDAVGIAEYLAFQGVNGPGTRQSPYSFDMSVNPM